MMPRDQSPFGPPPEQGPSAGLKDIQGVLVGGLSAQSPSAKAGIQPGDIITAINGRPVDRVSTLQRILFGFQPGESVTLEINRYGATRTVHVTLSEPPNESAAAPASPGEGSGSGQLGLRVEPLTPGIARQLQLPANTTGLVVDQVDPSGPAGTLQRGDVIESVLGRGVARPVHTAEDLRDAVQQSPNGVVSLLVYSPQAGGTRVVNIPLKG
jgi:serine protease Do